jgi:hypothetical protein
MRFLVFGSDEIAVDSSHKLIKALSFLTPPLITFTIEICNLRSTVVISCCNCTVNLVEKKDRVSDLSTSLVASRFSFICLTQVHNIILKLFTDQLQNQLNAALNIVTSVIKFVGSKNKLVPYASVVDIVPLCTFH